MREKKFILKVKGNFVNSDFFITYTKGGEPVYFYHRKQATLEKKVLMKLVREYNKRQRSRSEYKVLQVRIVKVD